MRDLINLIKMLESGVSSTQQPNIEELEAFKRIISDKIKQLPDDAATAKALREIEDLLKHVNAGGKMGIVAGKLASIDDPTVTAAQKELSRYIMSMDMTPADRDQMFDLWRNNKLIKIDVLLGTGKKDFSEIITDYKKNPAIRELSNDLMRISALGQGKGEFGLSVMSKSINKQEGKGDLNISGRPIEVKTTDGGAGRFTDQEVRPGPGFDQAARKLDAFIKQYQPGLAKSGANLDGIVQFYEVLAANPDLKKEADTYFKLISEVIENIFQGMDISPIMNAIKQGNVKGAKQEYAKTNFNYYMKQKKDEGVLYISLTKDPIMTVFFKNADELAASGLRLHAGTTYITSVADVRLPYPQIEIVDTSAGGSSDDSAGSSTGLSAKPALSADELDAETGRQRLTGPGARAAKAKSEPKTDTNTLGRERRPR
jgi:hypothetical protein